MNSEQTQKTVNGYIIAIPRGNSNEDSAHIALHDDNGTEYLVVPKGIGIDLMEHVNARAEVTGLLEEKDEALYLLVRSYNVQDGFEDDWYDDKE